MRCATSAPGNAEVARRPTPRDYRLTVLVLGVGGNVSQGILKALALSKLASRTVGACISRGRPACTRSTAPTSPRRRLDPSFPDWLIDVCRRERVDAVLSGVEAVLDVLAQQQEAVRRESGRVCIVSSPDRLRIANDKLGTAHWLAQQGLGFPGHDCVRSTRRASNDCARSRPSP